MTKAKMSVCGSICESRNHEEEARVTRGEDKEREDNDCDGQKKQETSSKQTNQKGSRTTGTRFGNHRLWYRQQTRRNRTYKKKRVL